MCTGGAARATKSFSGDGKVSDDFWLNDDYPYEVLIQPDGKILIGGNESGVSYSVLRLNPDGSPDTSFGGAGVGRAHAGLGWGYAMALQEDGKILIAGEWGNNFGVARFTASGSLDTSFDTDGRASINLGAADGALAIAIQSDGQILLGGYSGTNFAAVRLNSSNGSLDTSFDTDGKVITSMGGDFAMAEAIAVQADGKVLLGGTVYSGTNSTFALARYTTGGALDTAFDTDGKQTVNFNNADYAYGLTVQGDGKILAAGPTYSGTNSTFAMARLNSDGSLDTGFDSDGKLTTSFTGDSEAYDISVAGNRIVAAGYDASGGSNSFAVAVYSTGQPQRLFAQTDANHNVTSIADSFGTVKHASSMTPTARPSS